MVQRLEENTAVSCFCGKPGSTMGSVRLRDMQNRLVMTRSSRHSAASITMLFYQSN